MIQKLTWAMKQSIGLSAPSLTVVFLFDFFFMRHVLFTLSSNTWKGDFPAKYSCHPLTLEKSNQSNPWLCQLGGGLQLFECVHFQKYFIAHHFTVGFWILSNCCLFGWDHTLKMPLCSSGLRFRRNIYNHQVCINMIMSSSIICLSLPNNRFWGSFNENKKKFGALGRTL